MIILRQKVYAEPQENQGMSTGKKVALGTLGTLGTAGLAFAGARRGAFGGRAMLKTNRFWGNTGSKISKLGFEGVGKSMMESGAKGMGEGTGKLLTETLKNKGVAENVIKSRAQNIANKTQNTALQYFQSNATKVPSAV